MKKKYRVTLVKKGEVCQGDVYLRNPGVFLKICADYGWVLTDHFELGEAWEEIGIERVECRI